MKSARMHIEITKINNGSAFTMKVCWVNISYTISPEETSSAVSGEDGNYWNYWH